MDDGIDLFPSERGNLVSETTLIRRFRRYCDDLDLSPGLDLHSFRRSYATHLLEAGWDAYRPPSRLAWVEARGAVVSVIGHSLPLGGRFPQATRHDRSQLESTGGTVGDMSATPRFLQLADVAEILNTSGAQVYALVRRGELRAIKIGGRGQWRVEASELEAYIERAYADAHKFVDDHPFVEGAPTKD